MRVRVLFFGILKDLAQRGTEDLDLSHSATISDLLAHYAEIVPTLTPALSSLAVSINQEYAGPEARLNDGDEIALLPPVSGGSQAAEGRPRHAAIVHEIIDAQSLIEGIKQPADGACVLFEGIVRNNSRGRSTLYLDYEAYEPMALKQMEELGEQALAKFQIRDVAIVHRVGRLEIGETSVLVLVASAHRGAAFDACRWIIDTLKRTVPIWKKEHFEDGAVWADGEPFPEEIPALRGTLPAGRASK
jgi:molybdopterin synthase catalytic subunit/molybdopterin converting factor small subunit